MEAQFMGPGKVNNNHVSQVARWKATKSVAMKAMKRKCRSAVRPRAGRKKPHCYYHRLLAMTLLHCVHDDWGNRLAQPRLITAGNQHLYQVHHLHKRTSSCRLSDFVVVTVLLHERLTQGLVKDSDLAPGQVMVSPQAL